METTLHIINATIKYAMLVLPFVVIGTVVQALLGTFIAACCACAALIYADTKKEAISNFANNATGWLRSKLVK